MKKIKWLIPVVAVALALGACSSQKEKGADGGQGGQRGQGGQGGGSGNGNGGGGYPNTGQPGYYDGTFGGNGGGAGGVNGGAGLNQRVIHFAYDSSRVRPEDMGIVEAHARYLAANPNKHVRLEGHADERGSREYNIALSLERAESVQRILRLKGANADMRSIPYGEEMPIALGHNASAWNQNRRVEIIY
jgi:peptidoglycan-associated lipoprotein